MIIHNAEHTFFYIDPNIKQTAGSVGGDGSSAANAAMDFPTEFRDNVVYLIRRSDKGYYARLPIQTTSSNITSLVILGMPKKNEKYWDMMPEDAKAAWEDANVETDYASICKYSENYEQNCRTGWELPSCKNITLRNLNIMKYDTRWNVVEDSQWVITAHSSYGCNGDIQRCRFGLMIPGDEGSELGNASHLANLEEDVDYNPNYYLCGRFLLLDESNWASICTIKDIEIDNYGRYTTIHCGRKRNIVLENIVCRTRQAEDRGEGIIDWSCDDRQWRCPTVHMKNCSYVLYYSQHDRYMRRFFTGWVERIYVDGLTASIGQTQNYTPYDGSVAIRPLISVSTRYAGSSIKNVNCNFPDFHGASGQLIAFDYLHDDANINASLQDQYIEVKDISITMCQGPTAKYSNYSHNDSDANIFNSSEHGLVRLRRTGHYDRLISSDFLVQNLQLKGARSVVAYFDGCILDMQEDDVVGSISLFNCVGKIRSIESWYPGNIVNDRGSCLLYIGKITCNLENTSFLYNKQPSVMVSGRSHILVHEVNGNCWTSDTWSIDYPHSYICTNDGMPGNYTCRTGRSKCQTWSAFNNQTDTGCSLKLTNDSGNDWRWPLRIGADPFKGIIKPVTAGKYNATFYLALYAYNIRFDEIADRLFIRIKLPDGTYVYSSAGVCEKDTTTVWTNIEGTTNYKFVIPLDIDQNGEIEIDFTWSFSMDGGITILDPYPKLTARA